MSDNPQAFPSHAGDPEMNDPRNRISCGGMTLRDWFAGQAMAGAMANADLIGTLRDIAKGGGISESALLTGLVFEIADAMLAARKEAEA